MTQAKGLDIRLSGNQLLNPQKTRITFLIPEISLRQANYGDLTLTAI